MEIQLIKFAMHGDERGNLVAIEESSDIPFDIKRVYYIFDTERDVIRGLHAHKRLEQVLICVHGSCIIKLDNGYEQCTIELKNPSEGLYIPKGIWREMYDFSSDAVLLVLASEHYDEEDYIRKYDDFIEFIKQE